MKNNYKLPQKNKCITLLVIILIILLISKLFYGNIAYGILLSPATIVIYKIIKKKYADKCIRQMETQFKDLLISVSDLMQAGYSVENAFIKSYIELTQMYGDNSLICKELNVIKSQIKLNVNIEKVIEDFAKRCDIDSINTFYQTFTIAKRTGGNMRDIIKNVTDTITLKENVKEDIEVAMKSQRLEQRVMMTIPVFLIIYVSFASPGFLDVMYKTWIGKIIMSICLVGYLIAFVWGEKITNIEV